jgi:hypothetical protein
LDVFALDLVQHAAYFDLTMIDLEGITGSDEGNVTCFQETTDEIDPSGPAQDFVK